MALSLQELLEQSATDPGPKQQELLLHRPRGWTSKVEAQALLVPLEGYEGGSAPGLSPSRWWVSGSL